MILQQTQDLAVEFPPFPAKRWDDLILFLDFDGTLVDLAETPSAVEIPAELPSLLDDLRARLGRRLFLLSGRDVETLGGFLPGYRGEIIGSHGAERRVDGAIHRHPLSGSGEVREIWRVIDGFADAHSGIVAEHKPTGGVLHYRRAPQFADEVRAEMLALAAGTPDFEIHQAKMALELRPAGIGKVDVLRTILDGETGRGRVPVVFGDDATDEPALELTRDRGGLAVKVGEGDTVANFRLGAPADVRAALRAWLDEAR
jgi:trehalose 6-phosphate phosphatase